MTCYLCGKGLNESNPSPEHIIPDALGNNITSNNLLCGSCNNGLASQIDREFVKFHGYLYDLVLQAKPNSRVDDRVIGMLLGDSKVSFGPRMEMDTRVEIPVPGSTPITFTAPPAKAERRARRIINELKKKYPQMDADRMLGTAQRGKEVLRELVFFSNYIAEESRMGGPAFFRGIKKIAVNFYLSKGLNQQYIQAVINQVRKGEGAPKRISTFYYPTIRPVHQLATNEISHVIKLVGSPDMKLLYCYIELFNVSHSLILLNDDYDGPKIHEQYCYDVLSSTHLTKDISLPLGNRENVMYQFDFEIDTNAQGQVAYDRTRKILHDILKEKGYII